MPKNIYTDFASIPVYYANLLPTFYYSGVAQMKLFTMRQKKSFAEKAIEYGKEGLKIGPFLPISTWSYQMLTNSYSQLIYLSKKGPIREEYVKMMLESANQAEKIEYQKAKANVIFEGFEVAEYELEGKITIENEDIELCQFDKWLDDWVLTENNFRTIEDVSLSNLTLIESTYNKYFKL